MVTFKYKKYTDLCLKKYQISYFFDKLREEYKEILSSFEMI